MEFLSFGFTADLCKGQHKPFVKLCAESDVILCILWSLCCRSIKVWDTGVTLLSQKEVCMQRRL